MKYAFWLLVMAFSASALFGGYVSGRAAVPRFPKAAATATPLPLTIDVSGGIPQTDETANDDFAQDDAVAVDAAAADVRSDARLTFVLVDAGHSVALESPFLSLGVPVTLVVDPSGAAAHEMLRLCAQTGQRSYVQAGPALTKTAIEALHRAYPQANGVAARLTGDAAVGSDARAALRRAHWGVLNEYGGGTALARSLTAAGIPYAARSITVDDHLQRTYVAYMLHQAVRLSRGRTATVMLRPFPNTLRAVEDLIARAPRDAVRFVALPVK